MRNQEYLYDFGDGWEHSVRIERITDAVPSIVYPRLLDATGRCPPEDVGGPWGYREFLDAIADLNHQEHAQRLNGSVATSIQTTSTLRHSLRPCTASPRSRPILPTSSHGCSGGVHIRPSHKRLILSKNHNCNASQTYLKFPA
jgi:Plasmid pRiA4b ORF-3-like protein